MFPTVTIMFANNNLEPNENNSSNDLFENDFVGNHFIYHHSKSILKKAAEIICIDKLHIPASLYANITPITPDKNAEITEIFACDLKSMLIVRIAC